MRNVQMTLGACASAMWLAAGLAAQKPDKIETPGMTWHKDLAAAHAASAEDGKPVLAYFTYEG